jgi:alpha/beta hydrolase fold
VPFKLSNIHEPISNAFEHPVQSYVCGTGEVEIEVMTPKVSAMNFSALSRVGSTLDKDSLERITRYMYLNRHPLVSPIFAPMAGLPPALIQAGEAEMLRDETLALVYKINTGLQDPCEWWECST